jgi:hypothetical protein
MTGSLEIEKSIGVSRSYMQPERELMRRKRTVMVISRQRGA